MSDLDRDRMLAFWHGRAGIASEQSTRFHASHLSFDIEALATICTSQTRVLEIGCGRCTLLNRLVSEIGLTAHGVDLVPEFLESALPDPRLTIEVADAASYVPGPGFDVVILAGLINYLPKADDRDALYTRIANSLRPDAVLFVKSQFGRKRDVEIDSWSETLSTHYICFYPKIDDEVARLGRWFDVEIRDCYPPELSPHVDTIFFHLVCRKGAR